MKNNLFVIILSVFTLISEAAFGQHVVQLDRLYKSSMQAGTTLRLENDFDAYTSIPSGNVVSDRKVNVKLHYTRKYQTDINDGRVWDYKVKYRISDIDNGVAYQGEVAVDFSSGSTVNRYLDIESYSLTGNELELEILGVEATYNGQPIPDPVHSNLLPIDILLTIESSSNNHIYLDETDPIQFKWVKQDKLLSWNYVDGAEMYDLEWVYIDASDDFHNNAPSSLKAFTYKKAVRIRTPFNHYTVETVYPAGKLYFRVRAIGKYIQNVNGDYSYVKEGLWQTTEVSTSQDMVLTFNASPSGNQELITFENDKNWTVQKSFIEEGKNKAIVSFFDGSFRNRQVNTRLSSENEILTAETYYDKEGRQALAVIPAPNIGATDLSYNYHHNLQDDGSIIEANDYVGNTSFLLSNTTGAGQYYSPNNPDVSETADYIPNAEGYAFTQTEYERDGRSRVTKASGIGSAYKMGSGREQYSFVETAKNRDLHALFGSNVGIDKHYRKIYSTDPNGQTTITYQDLAGKTIATGLFGKVPDNLMSIGLTPIQKTYHLTKYDVYEPFNGKISTTSTITNFGTLAIDLDYKSFIGDIYEFTMGGTTTCEYCAYKVKLWIVDPDGNLVDLGVGNGGTQFSASIPNTTLNYVVPNPLDVSNVPITATCSGATGSYEVSNLLTASLTFDKIGEYKIYKEIEIDTDHFEERWETLKSVHDNMYNDFLSQEMASIDLSSCEDWCDQNPTECEDLQALNGAGTGFDDDIVDYGTATCNAYYQQMLADVGVLNGVEGREFADPDFWIRVNNTYVQGDFQGPNGDLSVSDVEDINNWNDPNLTPYIDSWKESLVKSHREYCLYKDCISSFSINWKNDILRLQQINDWQSALSGGDIDPLNGFVDPAWFVSGFPSVYTPANHDATLASSEKTKIHAAMENFAKVFIDNDPTNGTTVVSLYEYLSYTFQGGGNSANVYTHNESVYKGRSVTEADEVHWKMFLGYYIDIKNRIHTDELLSNCTTISLTELNDMDEGCVFPPVPEYTSGGYSASNPMYDLTLTSINTPQAVIDQYFGTSYGQVNSHANGLDIANLGCDEICQNNVDRWMMELEVACPALTTAQIADLRSKLESYCQGSCGSYNNPTGFIVSSAIDKIKNGGAVAGEPLYDAYQILDNAGCGSAIDLVIEPSAISVAGFAACEDLNDQVNTLMQIHNYLHDNPTAYEDVLIDYPFNTQSLYSHLGANYGHPTNTLLPGPDIKLKGRKNWMALYWDFNNHACEDADGNALLTNTQYLTLENVIETGSCYDNYDNGCIAWAFYDEDGNSFDLNQSTPTAGWISSWHPTATKKIVAIEYIDDLPIGFVFSGPPMQGSDAITGVTHNSSDFVYRKLRAEFINGSGQTEYAYIFGDKNCIGGIENCSQNGTDWCKELLESQATSNADQRFEEYLNEQKALALEAYTTNCANHLKDELLYTSTETEGYFTLYYYDQAGNLVQTVPPAGVDIVDNSHFPGGVWDGTEPLHTLQTTYEYNGLNQLIRQNTPDGGTSRFFYNVKGQLLLSQNAEQKVQVSTHNGHGYKTFSYSEYDALGRVKEAGQVYASLWNNSTSSFADVETIDKNILYELMNTQGMSAIGFQTTIGNGAYTWRVWKKEQVIRTYYGDDYSSVFPTCNITRENVRSRVVATTFKHGASTSAIYVDDYDAASHYSYDELGNVKTLIQEHKMLAKYGVNQSYKRLDYDYDYISGNVKKVAYQAGKPDQFYHKYTYDEDNRIVAVYTSTDDVTWDKDAGYDYLKHGPLHRVELGQDIVQGQDMAYTLQGWLKGTNSTLLDENLDMAHDAKLIGQHQHRWVARDAYAYTLGYYLNDFKGIGGSQATAFATPMQSFVDNTHALYNGNIAFMTTGFMDLDEELSNPVKAYSFKYDQLNRFKSSRDYNGASLYTSGNQFNNWNGTNLANQNYVSNVEYDLNGNITKLKRYGDVNGVGQLMDDFEYTYQNLNQSNKLDHVKELMTDDALFSNDLDDDQQAGNYAYDNIGNLIKDEAEGIVDIKWTVSGKVKEIIKDKSDVNNPSSDLEFVYDAGGNRIAKIVKPHKVAASGNVLEASLQDEWEVTHYVRDASGNVMATYSDEASSYAASKVYPHIAFNVLGHSGHVLLQAWAGSGATTTTIIDHVITATTAEEAAQEIVDNVNFPFVGEVKGTFVKIYYNATAPFSANYILRDDYNDLGIEVIKGEFTPSTAPALVGSNPVRHGLTVTEHPIYGSSRIGIKNSSNLVAYNYFNMDGTDIDEAGSYEEDLLASSVNNTFHRDVANKHYELSNHLGNVIAVVNDKKLLKEVTPPSLSSANTGPPSLQIQQFNATNGWQSSGNGSVTLDVDDNLSLQLKDAGDKVENLFQAEQGKLYTIDFDVANNTVDNLYLSVLSRGDGTSQQEIALTGSGHHTIELAATTGELSVAFIQRGANSATAQSVSINNLILSETLGDQLASTTLEGLGNWSTNNLDLSIEEGKLKAYGELGGYIERIIPTEIGKAYVVKFNSIYQLPGLTNTLYQIRIRALNGSNGSNFKHTQLGSGEREFFFVANEASTIIRLQTWSNVSQPAGSPAGFMLEDFAVYEMEDAGSPVALSTLATDWVATGGAVVSNDQSTNDLLVNLSASGDRAKLPVPAGIMRIDVDHDFVNGTVSSRVILDGNYTFDVSYASALPGVKSAIDNFNTGGTVSFYYTQPTPLTVSVKGINYVPQSIGAQVLSEDYELPTIAPVNGGRFTSENGTIEVVSNAENDGIIMDVKASPKKSYKISFDVDSKTTDFHVVYKDYESCALIESKYVSSIGHVDIYVDGIMLIDNQIEWIASDEGTFKISNLNIEEVNETPVDYNELSSSSHWQPIDNHGYVKDGALWIDGPLGEIGIHNTFETTPGKAYKVKYNFEFPEGEENYAKQIRTTIYNNDSGTGKRYFSHFGYSHPDHSNGFVFVAETDKTEIIGGLWTNKSSDYGKRSVAVIHDIQLVEMDETVVTETVSLESSSWTVNKGATLVNSTPGELTVDFAGSGDNVYQTINPSTPGYYKMGFDFNKQNSITVGLYTQFYDRFTSGNQKSTAFYSSGAVNAKFQAAVGATSFDVENLSYTKLKQGTVVSNSHFDLPSVSFLGDVAWSNDNEAVLLTADQANDGLQVDLSVSALKSYTLSFETVSKTTDFTAQVIDIASNTVLVSEVVSAIGVTNLSFDVDQASKVALQLIALGTGEFSFKDLSVVDQNPGQQPVVSNPSNELMGWRTDDSGVSMSAENGRLKVVLADQVSNNTLYRDVQLIPGKAYKASIKVSHEPNSSSVEHVQITGGKKELHSSPNTLDGLIYDVYFVAHAEKERIALSATSFLSVNTQANTYTIDDFSVVALEEVIGSNQNLSLNVADWSIAVNNSQAVSLTNASNGDLEFGFGQIGDAIEYSFSGLSSEVYRVNGTIATTNDELYRFGKKNYYSGSGIGSYVFSNEYSNISSMSVAMQDNAVGTMAISNMERVSLVAGQTILSEDYNDSPMLAVNNGQAVIEDGMLKVTAPTTIDGAKLKLDVNEGANSTFTFDLEPSSDPVNVQIVDANGVVLASQQNVQAGTTGLLNFNSSSSLIFAMVTPVSSNSSILMSNFGSLSSPTVMKQYFADVLSYNDYYPFGMLQPGRHANSNEYRYGFNGMEKDDEVKGSGNSLDFGARIYDSRIGRWLARDPLFKKQPGWSPYKAFLDNPNIFIDPDGRTEILAIVTKSLQTGKVLSVRIEFANNVMTDGRQHFAGRWTQDQEMYKVNYYDFKTISQRYLDENTGRIIQGQKTSIIQYDKFKFSRNILPHAKVTPKFGNERIESISKEMLSLTGQMFSFLLEDDYGGIQIYGMEKNSKDSPAQKTNKIPWASIDFKELAGMIDLVTLSLTSKSEHNLPSSDGSLKANWEHVLKMIGGMKGAIDEHNDSIERTRRNYRTQNLLYFECAVCGSYQRFHYSWRDKHTVKDTMRFSQFQIDSTNSSKTRNIIFHEKD